MFGRVQPHLGGSPREQSVQDGPRTAVPAEVQRGEDEFVQVFALLHCTYSKQAAARSRVRTYVHTQVRILYMCTQSIQQVYTHSTCAYTIHSRYTNCTVRVCTYIVHSRFKCSEWKSVHNDYAINETIVITMYSAVWPARPSHSTTRDAEGKGRDGGWRSLTSPTCSAVRWNGLASQTMCLTLLYCTSSHNVRTYISLSHMQCGCSRCVW